MSDVLGPDSFNGIILFFSLCITALVFFCIAIGHLLFKRTIAIPSALIVCALNVGGAHSILLNLGSKLGKYADISSPVWIALSIVLFRILTKKRIREPSE